MLAWCTSTTSRGASGGFCCRVHFPIVRLVAIVRTELKIIVTTNIALTLSARLPTTSGEIYEKEKRLAGKKENRKTNFRFDRLLTVV